MSSISRSVSELAEKPNAALLEKVSRALPWTSSHEQILLALKRSRNDVDAAVELLMLNPDGIDENYNDDNDADDDINVTEAIEDSTDSHRTQDLSILKPSPATMNGTEENKEVDEGQKNITTASDLPTELTDAPLDSCTAKAARRKERVLKKISVASKKQSRKVS